MKQTQSLKMTKKERFYLRRCLDRIVDLYLDKQDKIPDYDVKELRTVISLKERLDSFL